MTEEAFTITAADFMNFPPTFDDTFLDNTSFANLRNKGFLDKFKLFNPLYLFTEASERAAIRKIIRKMDAINRPYEQCNCSICKSKKGSQFISELIRKTLFK